LETKYYRPIFNVHLPKIDKVYFYVGNCKFLKTDLKTHVCIHTVYTHRDPSTYEVKLVVMGTTFYCDLLDLVPLDGDYL
jgi:hypothetical protein